MHPEELCRIIESNETNNSEEEEYEREMTSHEYLDTCVLWAVWWCLTS